MPLVRWTWRFISYEMHMKLFIHSFIRTSGELFFEFHMNFLCTSHEVLMSFVWIEYELLHSTSHDFTCISYVIIWISNAIHLNFISISYELHMNLTRNVYRKTRVSFMQTSYELHMNFIWSSYELHTNRMRVAYVLHMQLIWNTIEFCMKWLTMTSECIWSSCEVIVSYFIQTSTVFDMSCIWSTYETIMSYIWRSHEVHMKSSCNIHVCSPLQNYREVQNKVIWSSYKIYMNFR